MKLVRCENGHFYDPDRYTSCPLCAEKVESSVRNYCEEIREVFFNDGSVAYTDENGDMQLYIPDKNEKNGSLDNRPVVGWLVCVNGVNRGSSYCIHSGENNIGRGKQSDICVEGDCWISINKAAIIHYDQEGKLFYLGYGEGHNAIRLRGKMILKPEQLHPYDELQIGKTKFRFVPFCGENFSWEE